MTTGISGAGRHAEREFWRITGAVKAERASDGDALLDGRLVEIKQIASPRSRTLNQVRAVKYLPLVALYIPHDEWYVVPPDEIVRLVARRRRGQHTENPFESETLSLNNLGDYVVGDPATLRDTTLAAIEQGDQWPALRRIMEETRERSSRLAAESIGRVRRILAEGPS